MLCEVHEWRVLLVVIVAVVGVVGTSSSSSSAMCDKPPWYPPAPLAADIQLAEGVDGIIAAGKADETVRQLRRALSPTVLGDTSRYWDAPHEKLRRGLGRALLKASPSICPDAYACQASALAQFVAAERIRRHGDPLRALVPPDAIELREDIKPQSLQDSTVASLGQRLLDWAAGGLKAPLGHLQSIFDLPGREGAVQTFPARTMPPTVREFFTTYAPGATTGFLRTECREAVSEVCPQPWENCGHECMERCCRQSLDVLVSACLRRGIGKPFVLKGYASNWTAAAVKDDAARLVNDYATAGKGGRGPPTRIEYEVGLKETRVGTAGEMPLTDFIAGYETNEWYNVGFPPGSMMDDVSHASFLSCGGYTDQLVSALVWMSSGGTKSVVHYDDADNLNCLISGQKRMVFWSPELKDKIEDPKMGWVNHDDPNHEYATYGQYAGGVGTDAQSIDTDAVDLVKFPGWSNLTWWEAHMEAGDCLFIPSGWYHHVESPRPSGGEPQLNLGLNVWWVRTEELDEASVDDSGPGGCPAMAEPIVLSSCDFTEQDRDDVQAPTRCRPCYAAQSPPHKAEDRQDESRQKGEL